jgi:hypothetical protein
LGGEGGFEIAVGLVLLYGQRYEWLYGATHGGTGLLRVLSSSCVGESIPESKETQKLMSFVSWHGNQPHVCGYQMHNV